MPNTPFPIPLDLTTFIKTLTAIISSCHWSTQYFITCEARAWSALLAVEQTKLREMKFDFKKKNILLIAFVLCLIIPNKVMFVYSSVN